MVNAEAVEQSFPLSFLLKKYLECRARLGVFEKEV